MLDYRSYRSPFYFHGGNPMLKLLSKEGYVKVKIVYVTDELVDGWSVVAKALDTGKVFANAVWVLIPADKIEHGREHFVPALIRLIDANVIPKDSKLSNVSIVVDPTPQLAYVLD